MKNLKKHGKKRHKKELGGIWIDLSKKILDNSKSWKKVILWA